MMGRQTADQVRLFYEFHRSRGSPWHQRVRQSLQAPRRTAQPVKPSIEFSPIGRAQRLCFEGISGQTLARRDAPGVRSGLQSRHNGEEPRAEG